MHKIYCLFFFMVMNIGGQAQTLVDFETAESTPALTPSGVAVVSNPDKTGNSSDKVAYYSKPTGNWKAIYLNFAAKKNIGKNDRLTFKLRSSTKGRVFVKVVNNGTTILEDWAPNYNFQPDAEKWTDCFLDVSKIKDREFDRIEVNGSVDNQASANVYLDDLKLINSVSPNGEPIIDVIISSSEISLGESVLFDASGTTDLDGSIVSYQWDFNDGTTAAGDIVEHTFTSDGVLTVMLVVKDNQGYQSFWDSDIQVFPTTGKLSNIKFTKNSKVHEKAEGVFLVKGIYTNVYDPDVIKVDAIITRPDLTTLTVPCFFYQKATYKAIDDEWASEKKTGYWMLRFSSPQSGTHQVQLRLTDGDGTILGELTSITIHAGNKKGYIKPDSKNKQYYRHTTGEPFYPLGINAAWGNTTNYSKIITNLGAGKANLLRYWQVPFDRQALEWKNGSGFYNGLGVYSQEAAAEQDSIVSLCEANDLYVQLTLFQHGMFSETVDSNWSDNPYNSLNGGTLARAEQYFYDAKAKTKTKKLLRYIVARWGYSQNLFAWELFNEVNFTGGFPNQTLQWLPGVMSWHDEMGQYIKSLDAFDHLVTTSSDETHLKEMDKLTGLDVVQYHLYNTNLLATQVTKDKTLLSKMTRTAVINGEYGLDVTTANVPFDAQRISIWTGIMTQVPHLMWLWEDYTNTSWSNLFKFPAQYLANEDLVTNDPLSDWLFDATLGTSKLSTVGFKSEKNFYSVIYDPNNRNNLTNITCDFSALPAGSYTITQVDILTGAATIQEQEISSVKGRTHALPTFSKGIALKVKFNYAIILGAEEPLLSALMQLYPNPSKGDVHIDFPSTGFTQVECINATGKIIINQQVDPSSLSIELQTSLPAGFYLIRLIHPHQLISAKLIID